MSEWRCKSSVIDSKGIWLIRPVMRVGQGSSHLQGVLHTEFRWTDSLLVAGHPGESLRRQGEPGRSPTGTCSCPQHVPATAASHSYSLLWTLAIKLYSSKKRKKAQEDTKIQVLIKHEIDRRKVQLQKYTIDFGCLSQTISEDNFSFTLYHTQKSILGRFLDLNVKIEIKQSSKKIQKNIFMALGIGDL